MDQGLSGLVTGLANGIQGYLGMQLKGQQESALEEQKSTLEQQRQSALQTQKYQEEGSFDPDSAEALFSQISPEMGKAARKVGQDYYDKTGTHLTWDQGLKGMEAITKGLEEGKKANSWSYTGNTPDGKPVLMNKNGEFRLGDTSTIGPGGKPTTILPKSSTMPTAQARATGEFAKSMLPHLDEMDKLVDIADKKGYLGPVKGRLFNEFLAGKIGSTGDPEMDAGLGQLRAFNTLVNSGTMKVHFGSRGGQQMLEHFQDMLNAGKQSAAAMHGSINAYRSFMQGYAEAGQPQGVFAPKTGANNDPLGIR